MYSGENMRRGFKAALAGYYPGYYPGYVASVFLAIVIIIKI